MKLYACPNCKDSKQIDISASVFVRLVQFDKEDDIGTDYDEADDHSHEWDLDSVAICRACDHSDSIEAFERKRKKPKTPKLSKAQTLNLLLDAAREAQTVFWDALRALENEAGFDINDTDQDFQNVDIAELRRQARRTA